MSGDNKVEHPADRLARIQAERAEPEPTPCIYMVVAQQAPELGLTSAKTLSFGYSLVRVYEGGHDVLADELANETGVFATSATVVATKWVNQHTGKVEGVTVSLDMGRV